MAGYKAGCARIRLKSGINSSAYTYNTNYKGRTMDEDKFAKEMTDKMNNGVGKLSPIAHLLYFSLSFEFLSHGQRNTIRTPLLTYARYLGINDEKIDDISKQLGNAFEEIHTHTFVRYNFEIIFGSMPEECELFISVIDNSEENTAIIERVYRSKKYLS